MGRKRKIGLAVSGGADSTALLVLLAECRKACNFDAVVLHVDHGLREDSAEDMRYVRTLARRYGLPFHATRLHIVRRRGESLEMAARRMRLDFFARKTKTLRLDAIATGHHADDVAETFLLRLARGAGAQGLSGLKRISRIHVEADDTPGRAPCRLPLVFIRPLIDLRTAQLRAFLAERGMTWREDSTNTDLTIPRNKVRHVVLPWLTANLDARMTEHICKSAAILRGDLTLPGAVALPPPETPAPAPARYVLSISEACGFSREKQAIGQFPAFCHLSRKALAGLSLEVRTWRAGDKIAPTGMNGKTRKLQDVFVTAKVAPALRRSLPLLARKDSDEIIWVPGYRVAENYAVDGPSSASWKLTLEALT